MKVWCNITRGECHKDEPRLFVYLYRFICIQGYVCKGFIWVQRRDARDVSKED